MSAALWLIGLLAAISASAEANGPKRSTTTAAPRASTSATAVTTSPAVTTLPQHERKVSDDTNDKREAQEQHAREPVTVNQFCGSCGENAGSQQSECCDSGPNVTDWLMAGLTLALVILGTVLGFRQIDLMDGSLKTARDAADAAKTQAQSAAAALAHQISQERPWLTMKGDGRPFFTLGPGRAEGAEDGWAIVPWSILNVGKDAAWLYRCTVKVLPVDDRNPPESPPAFTEDPPFGKMPIPPGAAHSARASADIQRKDWKAIGLGLNALMAYGIIRYRDNSDGDHFTRFCFIWRRLMSDPDPNREVWHYTPVGPPAYVEYT